MRRFYSLLLTAAFLLVGTNAWAGTYNVGTTQEFETAWAKSATEDVVINLTSSAVSLTKTMWLGTQAIDGTPHSVEINLNGYPLTSSATYAFMLTHGTLKFSGSGQVTSTGSSNVFYITGSTNKDVDPSQENVNYFSHLVIGEGVIIANTQYDAAISIDDIWKGGTAQAAAASYIPAKPALGYITNIYSNSETNQNKGAAYGVRLDIYGTVNGTKYGVKSNGYLGNPNYYFANYPQEGNVVAYSSSLLPTGYTIAASDVNFTPYIYIHPTARITANAQKGTASKSPVALYAAGFARWKVEGFVSGSVGALVKSGDVDFSSATVEGTGETYSASIPSTSGTAACGSAIALESNSSYAGDINVTIGGDSKVTAQHGYAIDENVVTATNETKVDAITITGGTFQGGTIKVDPTDPESATMEVVMKVSEPTAIANQDPDEETTITIIGATASQGSATIGNQTLADYLADADTEAEQGKTHITFVDNGQGGTVMVISQGEAPEESKDTEVTDWISGTSVDWKHVSPMDNTPMVDEVAADLTLTELQMTQSFAQELTVKDGVTFKVGRIIMGSYAKITVEAGGKLIVTGEQGIVAPSVNNIVLKTQENKPAIFLFNPAVSSNRNPKATVEFTSKAFYAGSNSYVFQRFGIPMKKDGLTAITGAGDPRTRFWSFDYSNNSWKAIGFINGTGSDVALDYTKINDPFEYYQMMNFDATTPSGVVYTFTGSLLGNSEPTMQILENSWKGFANSYMGVMQLSELLKLIPNTVDKAIYTYNVDAVHGSWEPVTNLNSNGAKLNPMQPFLIRNRYDAAEVALDYGKTVYYPTTGETPPASAPSRAAVNDITMAKITIANENSTDYVIVAEDNEFTPSFDNGYDASKFMNDEVNLYVEAEEKMSIFATDKLENTTLGVSSVLGGKYTITFSDVNGDNFVLVDNMTGAQIAMTEGSSYEFEMAANTVNNHRFEIVAAAKMPTAIENTEVKANAKGVYTLMGQYVGENINKLPAGVYVVNGVKIVK